MKIISIKNIAYSVTVNGVSNNILNNISFEIEENSIFGISGESGSGKTTLAKIIAGFLSPTSGKIISNLTPRNRANSVQMLFQNTGNIINPYRIVFDVISEAAFIQVNSRKKSLLEAERILELLNIEPALWYNRGYELSGGEQQRVALARLLAVNPQLLILDEPFAAQDVESQLNILNLLIEIKKEFDLSLVFISHNLKILRKISNEMITIKNGSVVINQEHNTGYQK
jgi:nickel transport system ATP-binding protein